MVTLMKKLQLIIALLSCFAFAGRAAAQWTIIDLDDLLSRNAQLDTTDTDGCCCDDEEDDSDSCCDEPCQDDALPCHHHCCDFAVPGASPGEITAPSRNIPVIFEVSRPVGDGWRLGLERPPRLA